MSLSIRCRRALSVSAGLLALSPWVVACQAFEPDVETSIQEPPVQVDGNAPAAPGTEGALNGTPNAADPSQDTTDPMATAPGDRVSPSSTVRQADWDDRPVGSFADAGWRVSLLPQSGGYTLSVVDPQTNETVRVSDVAEEIGSPDRRIFAWISRGDRYEVAWQPADPDYVRLQVIGADGGVMVDQLMSRTGGSQRVATADTPAPEGPARTIITEPNTTPGGGDRVTAPNATDPDTDSDNIYAEDDNLPDDANRFPRVGRVAGDTSEVSNCREYPGGPVVATFEGLASVEIDSREVDDAGDAWFRVSDATSAGGCWIHDSRIDLL